MARSATSFLPSAPTVSSSRACVNREPEIILPKGASDEESYEEGSGDGDDDKSDDDEGKDPPPPLRFGPPKGHVKSVASRNPKVDGNFYLLILLFVYLLFYLDVDHSTKSIASRDRLVKGTILFKPTFYFFNMLV